MKDYRQYLDPRVVDKLGRLEVKARLIVEGFLQGAHRSPHRGASVEFAEHREYSPGDDLRHLDWKVYGRTDRFYIKQFEEETNLRCVLALDASGSMRFPEILSRRKEKTDEYAGINRYRYGTLIAAAMSFLLLRQRDAAGLALFDQQIRQFVEPQNNPAHLGNILQGLEDGCGGAEKKTSLAGVLGELAERISRRSLIVVISDFFAPVRETLAGLARLRSRNHDVLLFHLLSPEERNFEFKRHSLYRFVGLEESGELTVDPRAVRSEYQRAMDDFCRSLRRGCLKERVDYHLVDTDTSLEVPLQTVLSRRARRTTRR
jgi:uncharacterized protein (DUF58 family)